jgi:hypothetical protein
VKELIDSFFDGSGDQLLAYLRNAPAETPAAPMSSGESQLDAALL